MGICHEITWGIFHRISNFNIFQPYGDQGDTVDRMIDVILENNHAMGFCGV